MAKGPFGSQQFSARDGEADMSTNGKRHEANRVDPLIPTNPLAERYHHLSMYSPVPRKNVANEGAPA